MSRPVEVRFEETTRLDSGQCPECATKTDAHTGPAGGPRPGDLSICLYCGTLLTFTDSRTFRVATAAEQAEAETSADFRRLRDAITEFRKSRQH